MSKRSRKSSRQRLANQSKGKLDTRAKPQSFAPPVPKEAGGLIDFIEHPLFLAGVSIVGVIVGVVFYTPVLLVCVVCILLALHRSKVLRGQATLLQATAYGIVLILSVGLLWGVDVLVRKPAREYLQVASGSKPPIEAPNASVPARPPSIPVPSPGQLFNFPGMNSMAAPQPANPVRSMSAPV